jgi:hypothetical protein
MQARTLVLVILLVQGVYDLSLGGWLWLARQSLASARAPDSLHRLHALYCHCTQCADVENCCCIPRKQLANVPAVKRCDTASDAKLPDTWTARVVTTVRHECSCASSAETGGAFFPAASPVAPSDRASSLCACLSRAVSPLLSIPTPSEHDTRGGREKCVIERSRSSNFWW